MLLDVLVASVEAIPDQDELKLKALCQRLHQAAADQLVREAELLSKLEEMDKALTESMRRSQELHNECQKLRRQHQEVAVELQHLSKDIEQPMLELEAIIGKTYSMSSVEIKVGMFTHSISCGDGQEADLQALAAKFDQRLTALAQTMKRQADVKTIVMACLFMEKEIQDIKASLQEMQEQKLLDAKSVQPARDLTHFIDSLERVAEMLEKR